MRYLYSVKCEYLQNGVNLLEKYVNTSKGKI